jgi:hypothetical protein
MGWLPNPRSLSAATAWACPVGAAGGRRSACHRHTAGQGHRGNRCAGRDRGNRHGCRMVSTGHQHPVGEDGLRRTAYSWAVAGLCLCLTELFVYILADPPLREDEYPTLTYLLQPFVDQTVWRAVLLSLWLASGLALLRWSSSAGGQMKSTVVE